jgi:hypothetical protein
MQWGDSANVCGTKSEESKTHAASEAPPEALTDGTASQPLTRIDCDKANMVWNESANVCGEKSEGTEAGAAPKIEAGPQTLSTAASNQPLTRSDCDKAGMGWNERGKVCGAKTEGLKGQAASVAAPKAKGTSKAGSAQPKAAKAAKSQAHTKRKYTRRHSAQPSQTFERPFWLHRNLSHPAQAKAQATEL